MMISLLLMLFASNIYYSFIIPTILNFVILMFSLGIDRLVFIMNCELYSNSKNCIIVSVNFFLRFIHQPMLEFVITHELLGLPICLLIFNINLFLLMYFACNCILETNKRKFKLFYVVWSLRRRIEPILHRTSIFIHFNVAIRFWFAHNTKHRI